MSLIHCSCVGKGAGESGVFEEIPPFGGMTPKIKGGVTDEMKDGLLAAGGGGAVHAVKVVGRGA